MKKRENEGYGIYTAERKSRKDKNIEKQRDARNISQTNKGLLSESDSDNVTIVFRS